jgi:hypothetical protein
MVSTDPRYSSFESGMICFEEEMHGAAVTVAISRRTVEGHTGTWGMDDDECLFFVTINREQIVENLASSSWSVVDSTVRAGSAELAGCQWSDHPMLQVVEV